MLPSRCSNRFKSQLLRLMRAEPMAVSQSSNTELGVSFSSGPSGRSTTNRGALGAWLLSCWGSGECSTQGDQISRYHKRLRSFNYEAMLCWPSVKELYPRLRVQNPWFSSPRSSASGALSLAPPPQTILVHSQNVLQGTEHTPSPRLRLPSL